MLLPKPIWKNVPGYENLYQVSNLGQVRSLNYRRTGETKILKPEKDTKGYLRVTLCKNGKRKNCQVHRLVALSFIQNDENLPCVNHKDENPSNNHVENLEWCSYKYNNNFGSHNKKMSESKKGKKCSPETKLKISEALKGDKSPCAKQVLCLEEPTKIFPAISAAAAWSSTRTGNIASQIKGNYKTSGKHPLTGEKLHWQYWDIVLQEATITKL